MSDKNDHHILRGVPLNSDFTKHLDKTLSKYLVDVLLTRDGNQILMVDEISGEELTVNLLLQNSYRLASYFLSLGFNKGNVIGILSENRIEYSVVILATLHIGGIFTAFNPLYTSSELEHTCNISKPSLIFVSPTYLDKAINLSQRNNYVKHIIVLDDVERIRKNGYAKITTLLSVLSAEKITPHPFTPVKYSPEDGVMILYSSGTTGLPKGVTLTSKGLIYVLQIKRDRTIPGPKDNSYSLLVLPMFHGFAAYIILANYILNFTLVISKQFNEKNFLANIVKYKADFFYLVPPVITLLSKSPLINQYDLSSMKEIVTGSTTLNAKVAIDVMNKLKLTNIYEAYGMTEVSFVCTASNSDNVKLGSAGKVLPGIKIKVIDIETGETLGPMKTGEICIKGLTLMKGYYGNPKATAETIDSDNWLHSGDIGYYDQEQFLYIVGRIKELIKYKAYQVAPAELEKLLTKHPQIKDAAVIGVPDELAGELPKAFVVKKPQATITENDIQQYISERVSPQKKLRGGVEFIDEIPRNASGKILRRVLQAKVKSKL